MWSDEVIVGVIAQELINTHPEALIIDKSGYYLVDYSIIGLKMVTIEQWQESIYCVYA